MLTDALTELRKLASDDSTYHDTRAPARLALKKLVNPDEKPRAISIGGEVELLCEARATYAAVCAMATGRASSEEGLNFSQLTTGLSDFGMHVSTQVLRCC